MIKNKVFYICLVIVLGFSYVKAEKANIDKNILYEFQGYSNNILSNNYFLKDFFIDNGVAYDKNNQLNLLFSPNTPIDNPIRHRKPFNGEALFFKEITHDEHIKLFLFAYWDRDDQDSYLNLPTLELQIFDSKNSFIDKMIIVDGASAECPIKRTVRMYSNMSFDIKDTEGCWDIDTDKFILNIERITHYYIDDKGIIQNQ